MKKRINKQINLKMKKMKNVFTFTSTILIAWMFLYFGMPLFASGFIAKWMILFILLILAGLVFVDGPKNTKVSSVPRGTQICITGAILVLLYIIFIPLFTTWSLGHSESYQKLLGTIEERTITSDMSPTSPENIIVIDNETAERLANKKISDEDRALGSQVEMGEITLQKVGEKMYYIIPLLHSGIFKYWSNGDQGTPGYVMVNATNDKDVKLVRQVGGKPIRIVYQPNAYFSKNLERHVYMNGYMAKPFMDPCFEIDDNGKPFYVYSLYEKTIGFSGDNTIGALIVDVETGEMKEYKLDNIPSWVDRVQPESMISDQINDWGSFINGWFNPSDKDKLQVSGNLMLVYGDDGKCYFYAGLTSVGKDDSSVGFMLIDSRNKKVCYYKQAGATEKGSMTSAEGKWQEKGYKATEPRPYNIDGIWTYVMALKDNEGLVKAVAMVSVSNYEIVGVGENIKDALRDYKSALNGSGNSLVTGKKQTDKELEATITRISVDLKQGNSYYYFTVDSIKDKMFVVTSDISEKITVTEKGDRVHIGYSENGGGIIDVSNFDNLNIKLSKTIEQTKSDAYVKNLNDSIKVIQNTHDVNTKWDNLSPEQKKKAIEALNKK